MYVYYEHHRAPTGAILLTELRLSSRKDGRLEIQFYDPIEKMVFEAVKPLLKFPPLTNYSYAPDLKLWSYFGQYGVSGTYGEEVLKKIQTVVEAIGQPFKAFEIEDLAGQAPNNRVDMSGRSRKPKMSAEEFFYNHGVAAPQQSMTRESLEKKLATIMSVDISYFGSLFSAQDRKKSYRQAALRLHPDRNNGDSKAMSELNYLWQEWQKFEKAKETSNVV